MPGMLPDGRARHFFYFFLNAPDAHFARCPASVVGLLANRSESSSFAELSLKRYATMPE
jgi:hypothetical protein